MADHREVQRIETFLREWFIRRGGVRSALHGADHVVAVGEIEEPYAEGAPTGYGHFKKLDGSTGCYPGTLQLVSITKLARDLADEVVKA